MARVASFHLVRAHRAVTAMAHLATDRRRLRHVDGPRRSGACSAPAAGRTPGRPPTCAGRRCSPCGATRPTSTRSSPARRSPGRGAAAEESWHVRLRVIGGHGSWRGADVLGGLARGVDDGPIAVVTRADVRVRRLAGVPCRRSGGQRRAAARRPGCWPSAGIGELPGRPARHVQPVGGRRGDDGLRRPARATATSCAAPAPSAGTARSCSPASSPTPAQARGTVATRSPPDALARTCRGTTGTSIP